MLVTHCRAVEFNFYRHALTSLAHSTRIIQACHHILILRLRFYDHDALHGHQSPFLSRRGGHPQGVPFLTFS